MRALQTTIVTGVLACMLAGSALMAQTPPTQPPTSQPPTTQPPATPPAQPPATPATPPKPFPEGAKIAYIDLQRVAAGSVEGKAASSKLDEFRKKKNAELLEKNKTLEEMNKKLQQGGTVLNDQARGQLEKDVDKLQREMQFLQQDAQAELQQMENELQADFQRKLNPILNQVSEEKGLHMLFSIRDNGAIWVHTGLDLSDEVVKRLDAAAKK